MEGTKAALRCTAGISKKRIRCLNARLAEQSCLSFSGTFGWFVHNADGDAAAVKVGRKRTIVFRRQAPLGFATVDMETEFRHV